MGTARRIVGTLPFVPPEVLSSQALEGRCDLYALGATLYWALCGRHAYPSRTLDGLPRLWKARPVALPDELPEALASLVYSLLSVEVDARPRAAAEVMAQLSGIAGLDANEHLHVPQAYLTAPSLTGRDAEVSALRALLAEVANRKSHATFLSGMPGIGRSRTLDVAALEARLAGVQVLRLQGAEIQHGECGLAETVLDRVAEAFPDLRRSSPPAQKPREADRRSSEPGQASRARLLSRARALVRHMVAQGRC